MGKLGILISGRGSNMEAILNHIASGALQASVAVVISNKPTAPGLDIAQSHGVPTQVFDPKQYNNHDAYETAIVACLQKYNVDLVCLAGYMKLLHAPMLTAFKGRMVNIHPSLLPSFKGLHAQQQALDYGVKLAGCSAHYVTKDMDAGPIICQSSVPVLPEDTVDALSERILAEEHRIYAQAIAIALQAQ